MTAAGCSRRVRVGVSSCLLGDQVRFDGGHKRDRRLLETLGRFVEWVPVCPELECGLGVPREPLRLVKDGNGVRLLTVRSGIDRTDSVEHFAHRRVAALADERLCGYVLKKDSPTCGMERVKVYNLHGVAARSGVGLFAAALQQRFPQLPIEEEGRLSDPSLCENFVERVLSYRDLCGLFSGYWTVGALVRFHTAHKLALMAHSPELYRRLGRLVGSARTLPRKEVERRYVDGFMGALKIVATRRRHVNVLQHVAGYFNKTLDATSRAELAEVIEDYRRWIVPRDAPVALLRHYARVHNVAYLAGQAYLDRERALVTSLATQPSPSL